MDSLSHDFEVVSIGGGGSYFTSSFKTVYINLPASSISSDWIDAVGNSYLKEANRHIKTFHENVKNMFNDLIKIDQSISLEAFQFDEQAIEQAIASLTVGK